MSIELEMAQIMWKLARKNNWGACYDRSEHFKRFQNLDEALKELEKKKWILPHKKPFKAMSLNTNYKTEIIAFIEQEMPEIKGFVR